MNRRDFIFTSALSAFGFSILPGAGRIWKPLREERTLCLCGSPLFARIRPGYYTPIIWQPAGDGSAVKRQLFAVGTEIVRSNSLTCGDKIIYDGKPESVYKLIRPLTAQEEHFYHDKFKAVKIASAY